MIRNVKLASTASPGMPIHSHRQSRANGCQHLATGWQYAKRSERACIDHDFVVDQYFELTVVPALHINFGAEVSTKPRRHPDGVKT
jgi:hypothetical protein